MAIHGKKSLITISRGITGRESFRVTSMSGRYIYSPHDLWSASVNFTEKEALSRCIRQYGATYVIFSYTTPIAWLIPDTLETGVPETGMWVIPDTRYSRTTSNHQSIVRVETSHPGFYERLKS